MTDTPKLLAPPTEAELAEIRKLIDAAERNGTSLPENIYMLRAIATIEAQRETIRRLREVLKGLLGDLDSASAHVSWTLGAQKRQKAANALLHETEAIDEKKCLTIV